MSTIAETPDELRARIAISDKAAQGLVEQIDRLREQNAILLAALEALMKMMDDGLLVRDISHDHESGWAIRQIPLIRTLGEARAAIKGAKP